MKKSNFALYSRLGEDFWYIQARRDLLKKILTRTFGKRKNLKILDAGCGTGFNFAALSEFGAVYGVDLNKLAIAQAKSFKYKKLHLGDVNSLKYRDYFDVIVAIELIEHIRDDSGTLKNFCRYLKPGGILILTAPAFKFLWSADDDLAMHERRYSKKRLRDILRTSGLKLVFLTYRYFFQFFPASSVFFLQKFHKPKNSLEYTPKFLNRFLVWITRLENSLIQNGFVFPFGVGFFLIAKKPTQIRRFRGGLTESNKYAS